jgi:arginyl-tRNA synthetase
MNLEHLLLKDINQAFQNCFNAQPDESHLTLQPTRKEFEGAYTLVTFPFGRITKKKPGETGQILGEYLVKNSGLIEGFNVVKGFLNLVISEKAWLDVLNYALNTEKYGFYGPRNEEMVVEYSSPNTNKPLHLGHLRNNFLGYSISRIMEAYGFSVDKVNLVNDRGIHICKSMLAYQKFGNGETPGSSGIKGDHLVGQYYVKFDQEYKKEIARLAEGGLSREKAEEEASLPQEARQMLHDWENGKEEVVALWKKMNGWVYQGFDATYKRMGVSFDKTYYESETYLLGKNLVEEGLDKKVFYKKDDNSVWVDLSDVKLDQKLLLRGDGTSVYMTQDLGTAELRYQDFKFEKSVYVVGNEQDYHFKVLFTILKKLGRKYADGLYHLSYGMVDLPSGKMKSREGTVVDADDLMNEMADTARRHTEELGKIEGFTPEQLSELYETLALGALKFFLLKVDPKKRMLFNPEESIQFHGFTGPFVQYTHARISAILRKASELEIDYGSLDINKIDGLHETESSCIYLISKFPAVIREAAENLTPSIVAQYAYDVAKEYNRFYTEVSIFGEKDPDKLKFNIAFSALIAQTIKNAMELLGIQVPERM